MRHHLALAWSRLLRLLRAANVEWLAILVGGSIASGNAFLLLPLKIFGNRAGYDPIARWVAQAEWAVFWVPVGLALMCWPWAGPRWRLAFALLATTHWAFTLSSFLYGNRGQSQGALFLWPMLLGSMVLISRSGDGGAARGRGVD